MTGSNSRWKARRAIAAPSEHGHSVLGRKQQVQTVSGGNGFASENDRRVHFGLGKNPKLEKAVIRWPSGFMQTLNDLVPNRLYNVKEPS